MNSELLRGDKSNARARKASKDRFQVVLLDSLLKTGGSQQWDELPCLVMSVLLLETSKQSLYLLFKSFRGDSLPAHLEYLGPCDAVHMEFPTILLLPPGAPRGAVPEDHIAADAILGKNILLNPSLHHVEHRL